MNTEIKDSHPWDKEGFIIATNKSNLLKYIKTRTNKTYRLEVTDKKTFTRCVLYEIDEVKTKRFDRENLGFNPIKFCHLRDTLNDLSKLEGFQSKFGYIPIDEYVTQLDGLIKYFEGVDFLDEITEFPCESCDAIYKTQKEADDCNKHQWEMHDFMAKSVEEAHQK